MKLSESVGKTVKIGLFGEWVKVISVKDGVSERTKKRNPNLNRDGKMAIVRTIKTNKIKSLYQADSTRVYPPLQDWISNLFKREERPSFFKDGCLTLGEDLAKEEETIESGVC